MVLLAILFVFPPGALLVDTEKLQSTKHVCVINDRSQNLVAVLGLLAKDGDLDLRELATRFNDLHQEVSECVSRLFDAILGTGKDQALESDTLLSERKQGFGRDTLECLMAHQPEVFQLLACSVVSPMFRHVLRQHPDQLIKCLAGAMQVPQLNLRDRRTL